MRVTSIRNPRPFPLSLTLRSLPVLLLAAAALGRAPAAWALTCTSVASSNWSVAATWTSAGNCNRVPLAGDDVVIDTGTTLDTNSAALASLTVNGALTVGNNATARALTVTGNIVVGGAGTIAVGATAATHTLAAGGNLSNAGTVNFRPAANRVLNVTFNRNGNQTVSGAGAYTFNLINVNQGTSNANILDMQAAITVPSPFLTITNGTYKHSSPTNIAPWTTAAGATIPATGGFWLDSGAAVTTTGVNVTINGGYLRISDGTMAIGNANTTRLILGDFASTLLQLDDGTLTVTGGINSASNTAAGTFTVSGGTIHLHTLSAGAVYQLLLGTGTTLNWSGGTIVASKGNATTDDVDIRSGTQNVTGGTLQMGNGTSSGNQISMINGAGGQLTVWNLVLNQSNANGILMRSSTNVLNDLTINTLNTLVPNAGLSINVGAGNAAGGGNWTNNGGFTQGTSIVSLLGTEPSTVGGTTATTFYRLIVNKTVAVLEDRSVTLGINTTVSNTLTLTNGWIDAAAFTVAIPAGGSVVRGGACSADGSVNGCFVTGRLQKNFAVSGAAQTRTYEVGSSTPALTAYAPVSIVLGAVTTAGNIAVSSTAGDHPSLSSSALNYTKSANRFWTLANTGAVFTAHASNRLTFNFVAADLDVGASTAGFDVGRYNAPTWTVTPPPTPTRTATSTAIAGTTITTAALPGQYAVAETGSAVPTPGGFNTFESTTSVGAIAGVIKTKVAGPAFGLDVVAIGGGAQLIAFSDNVKLELLANTGGAYGADNCPIASSVLQTIASAAIVGGRSTVNFASVANAYRDVRVRVSYPAVLPTVTACSTDSFAIRPSAFANFSVSDDDEQTPGTTRALGTVTFAGGEAVHKAGRAFTVRSNAINAAGAPAITSNYDGTPTVALSACGGAAPCTPAFGALTLDTTHTSGQLVSNAASYNQVGSFTMQLVDSGFASIDALDGSTPAERTIQSSALHVGRFVPDHFTVVSLNTPLLQTACVDGGFTYIGQTFGYQTVPVITVRAEDANGNTTTFYEGAWWRMTDTTVTGKTYAAAIGTLDTTGITGTDPVIAASGAGVGTLTFGSGSGFFFARVGVADPFDANISLSINVIDADAAAASVNPVVFGAGSGMLFTTGASMRYGRVRLRTALGSELVDLPLAMTAEYYQGADVGFALNDDDTCTTDVSLALSGYTESLAAGETCVRDSGSPGESGSGCAAGEPDPQLRYAEPPDALAPGDFNLRLAAPGAGNTGSVVIEATVPAWLQFDWNGLGNENPSGQATFGIFGGDRRQIYTREVYD